MSRLQVGGLALVLNSIRSDLIGRTCVLKHHLGLHTSWRTGVTADAWEIEMPEGDYIIRSDWLMPLGDKQTQDELAKQEVNTQQYFQNIMMRSPTLFDSKRKHRVYISGLSMDKIRITRIRYFGSKNEIIYADQEISYDEALTRLKRIVRV